MLYIVHQGHPSDDQVLLVTSSLSLSDMQEIVRCNEVEDAACVLGVVDTAKVSWTGDTTKIVNTIAEYSPPVYPTLIYEDVRWGYKGPRLRLYQGNEDRAPMDPAVWKRLVLEIDKEGLWAKTHMDSHKFPKYLSDAKKMALAHAKTIT